MKHIVRAIMCAALLAGCAGHAELKPKFNSKLSKNNLSKKALVANQEPSACSLAVNVIDGRKKTTTNYMNISPEAAVEWLTGSLQYLQGILPSPLTTMQRSDSIDLSLEKAYVNHLATTKSGVVVISAKKGDIKQYYRGRITGLNWRGSRGEYHSALNRALKNALEELAADQSFKIGCVQGAIGET